MTKAPWRLLSLLDYAAVTMAGHSRKLHVHQNFIKNINAQVSSGGRHSNHCIHSSTHNKRRAKNNLERSGNRVKSQSSARSRAAQEHSNTASVDPTGHCSAITERYRRVNATRKHIKELLSNLRDHDKQKQNAAARLRADELQQPLPPAPDLQFRVSVKKNTDSTAQPVAAQESGRGSEAAIPTRKANEGAVSQSAWSNVYDGSSFGSALKSLLDKNGKQGRNDASLRPGRLRRFLHSLGTGDILEAMVTVSEAFSSTMELVPIVWNAFRGKSAPHSDTSDTASDQPAIRFAKFVRPSKPSSPAAQLKVPVPAAKVARNASKQGSAVTLGAKQLRAEQMAKKHVERATGKGRRKPMAESEPLPPVTAQLAYDVAGHGRSSNTPSVQLDTAPEALPGWSSAGWPVPGSHRISMYKPDWVIKVPEHQGSSLGDAPTQQQGSKDSTEGARLPQIEDTSLPAPRQLSSSLQHVLHEHRYLPQFVPSSGHTTEWQRLLSEATDTKPKPGGWFRLLRRLALTQPQSKSVAGQLAEQARFAYS
jgi:hypothetical protein